MEIIANILWSNDELSFNGKVHHYYNSHTIIEGIIIKDLFKIDTILFNDVNSELDFIERAEIINKCALLIGAELDSLY